MPLTALAAGEYQCLLLVIPQAAETSFADYEIPLLLPYSESCGRCLYFDESRSNSNPVLQL